MVNQLLGEIKLFGGNFAINGWATCSGQLMPIAQNTALFSLLGTQYGGNGQTNFALPDLRGRAAGQVGPSTYTAQGEVLGTETVNLTPGNYPIHNHAFAANSTGGAALPAGNFAASVNGAGQIYTNAAGAALQPLNNGASPVIGMAPGGSVPHENMMPFLVMTYLIAMTGVFPSRN